MLKKKRISCGTSKDAAGYALFLVVLSCLAMWSSSLVLASACVQPSLSPPLSLFVIIIILKLTGLSYWLVSFLGRLRLRSLSLSLSSFLSFFFVFSFKVPHYAIGAPVAAKRLARASIFARSSGEIATSGVPPIAVPLLLLLLPPNGWTGPNRD